MPATAFDNMLQANAPPTADIPKSDKEYHEKIGEEIDQLKESKKEMESVPFVPAPKLESPPKPEYFVTPPETKFASAGMLVATLGSLFTRHALTTAASSMANVLNSYNQGDMTRYEEAYNNWKINNENAMKMADWEQKNMKSLLDRIAAGDKNIDSTAKLYAAAMNNPALKAAAESGQVQHYADEHILNIGKMKKQSEDFELEHDLVQDGIADYKKTHNLPDNAKIPKDALDQIRVGARQQVSALNKPETEAAKKDKQAASDLDDLISDTDRLMAMVKADPNLVGLRGSVERIEQRAGSQITGKQYHPEATQFESAVEDLKTQLANPLLRTRYFSGTAQKKLDELVEGLDRWDDPTTVLNSFNELSRILKQKRGEGGNSLKEGDIEDGYKYLGGDPGNPDNWEKQ